MSEENSQRSIKETAVSKKHQRTVPRETVTKNYKTEEREEGLKLHQKFKQLNIHE
jgi:hypothetical protein